MKSKSNSLPALFFVIGFCSMMPFLNSRAETEEQQQEAQVSGGIELPMDDVDYPEGHFETRLWPEVVIRAVEIDHLKYLASAPETPAEDRAVFLEIVNNLNLRSQLNGPGF